MTSIERRLKALEQAEWDRVHALPPREWFKRGYIRLDRLPDAERAELEGYLSRAFDDAGYLVPTNLTTDERYRVMAILDRLQCLIPNGRRIA